MPSDHPGSAPAFDDEDPVAVLRQVQSMLSTIYHDANNPLSIISGNAQFMLELIRGMGLGDDLEQPVRDIDEACGRVSEELQDLRRLKERIGRFVDGADPPA